MNTSDDKLLVDRGRFLLYETWRAVVPFIINITMEINYSIKVYSNRLLKSLAQICPKLPKIAFVVYLT